MTMISTAEMVRGTHGAEDGWFPLVGQTVAQAWQSLKAPFNIPGHALTRVYGSRVPPSHRLVGGDSLEFSVERGHKGVGDHVWSHDEFMALFKMEPSDWDQWRDDGLPVQTLPNGQIRLVETEVDVWLRDRRVREEYVKSLDRDPPKWFRPGQWYRLPYEIPPLAFGFGPLEGTKQQIAAWMFPYRVGKEQEGNHRYERAMRMLQRGATNGRFWVRRNTDSNWEVWFRSEKEYVQANGNYVRERDSM